MDPFEDGLSTLGKLCSSISTIDQRSNSASSEATGSREHLPSIAGTIERRRHIVRSGGTSGTEILTGFRQPKTIPNPSLAGKRPREDVASAHNRSEERLAQAAVEKLSERCSQILQTHAEVFLITKHRKAQNVIQAQELPYASPEYLLEFVRQAAMQFLDDKVKIEDARRPVLPAVLSLSSASMHPPAVNSVLQFDRPQLDPYSQHHHYAAQDRRIRHCQRADEPYHPEQLWKDTIVDEAWVCHGLDAFSGPPEDFLHKINESQPLSWT